MKRYDFVHDYGYANMVQEPHGEYVLHSEAQAEIERLRELVKEAYHEGCMMNDEDWLNSDARAALDSPKRWKGA